MVQAEAERAGCGGRWLGVSGDLAYRGLGPAHTADRIRPPGGRRRSAVAGGPAAHRHARPRDKAKVEVAVQVVQRWVLARLRHRRFFSLAKLNGVIREVVTDLNDRPMRHLATSRRALFCECRPNSRERRSMRRKDGKAWSSDGRRGRLTSPPPLRRLGGLAAFASTLPPAAHPPGPPPSWPRPKRAQDQPAACPLRSGRRHAPRGLRRIPLRPGVARSRRPSPQCGLL
jgi:hypothetical protein